jgi:hypothetical protein
MTGPLRCCIPARRYAAGNVPITALAERYGVGVEQVRKALRNPLYNGWALRNRGRERVPASWRHDPPVSDDLWERVQAVRAQRGRGGCAPGKWRRGIDPLGGLLYCACGARIRTNGTSGSVPRRQRIHPIGPCAKWGPSRYTWADVHDDPVFAQIAALRLNNATLERIQRALGQPSAPAPTTIDAARVERRKRDLALDHAAGRIDDDAYLKRMAELRKVRAPEVERPIDAAAAVSLLRNVEALWQGARDEQAWSDLLHAIYERIVVTRDGVVEVHLTPHAFRHGLALALPESVVLHKRPRQDSNLRPAA